MPIFMDRHFIEGATQHAIAHAHEKDLAIQEKHDVKFLTYWFDEERCTAFCLVDAPNEEAIQSAHDEAHGFVPHEIIRVDPAIVESFLGRVNDPAPTGSAEEAHREPAFRAVMFTDMLDSTQMTTTLGDSRALHLLHINNAYTRNALRAHGGREVKHTGDGIMASFASVPDAVAAAITIQKTLADHNSADPEQELHLRIGLSAGEPIEEHGDLFGTAVQLAARLCALADPGSVLVAETVYEQCKNRGLQFSSASEVTPKGFDRAVHVYDVLW